MLGAQDTVVKDPFYEHMPQHFGMSFKELLAAKHPTTWIDFEKGQCSEEEAMQNFFKDGRAVDARKLRQMMVRVPLSTWHALLCFMSEECMPQIYDPCSHPLCGRSACAAPTPALACWQEFISKAACLISAARCRLSDLSFCPACSSCCKTYTGLM